MTWFIFKGDDLKRDQSVRFPFYRQLSKGYETCRLVFQDELMMDDSLLPSPHPKQGVTSVNCVLTADLRKVDASKFKDFEGKDGVAYVRVQYDLVVSVASAIMRFSLEIDGEEMGSVAANYD